MKHAVQKLCKTTKAMFQNKMTVHTLYTFHNRFTQFTKFTKSPIDLWVAWPSDIACGDRPLDGPPAALSNWKTWQDRPIWGRYYFTKADNFSYYQIIKSNKTKQRGQLVSWHAADIPTVDSQSSPEMVPLRFGGDHLMALLPKWTHKDPLRCPLEIVWPFDSPSATP